MTVITELLYFFGMLAVNAPAMYAATWDSLLVHYSKVWGAFGDGKVVEGVAGLLRTVLLLVPVVGSTLLFLLVGKRLGMAVWRWSKGKAVLRAALIAAAVTIVGFAFSETVILSPVSSAASAVLGALPEGENLMPRLLGLGILVFILLIIGLGVWNLVGKRLDTAVWRWPEGKVALRAALIAAAVTIVGFAIGFAFWEGTILSLVSSVASAVFGALPQDEYAMRRLLGLAILALTFLVAGLAVRKLLMKRGGFRRW